MAIHPMKSQIIRALFGIGLVFHTASAVAAEGTTPVSIAVVKTWGDLLAQKPVTLQKNDEAPGKKDSASVAGEPLTFRLGIDQIRTRKQGGVVLYCLAQGDLIQIDRQPALSDPCVGPFLIDVRGPLVEQRLAALKAMKVDRFMISHPNALFMMPLPMNEAGAYVITLRQALGGGKSRDVASVKVVVSQEVEPSWSPWMDPDPTEALQAVEMTDFIPVDVANPAIGIALPKWDGDAPTFFSKLPEGNRPLPQWIAAQPDADIQLKLKNRELVVRFDEEISIQSPEDSFLTRWWVNGKLFTPKTGPLEARRYLSPGRQGPVKEVHFRLEFHPEYLGLKKGDTVGVQLLFCLYGWEETGPKRATDMSQVEEGPGLAEADQDLASRPIARVSNRLNFIYSGNPESPAAVDGR